LWESQRDFQAFCARLLDISRALLKFKQKFPQTCIERVNCVSLQFLFIDSSIFFTRLLSDQKRLTAIRGMDITITLSLMRPIWAEKLPRDLFLISRVYGKFLSFHTRRQSSLPGAKSPFVQATFVKRFSNNRWSRKTA
jgi:hypothetical protein